MNREIYTMYISIKSTKKITFDLKVINEIILQLHDMFLLLVLTLDNDTNYN